MARGSRSVSRYSTPQAVISTAALASLLDSSRRVASSINSYASREYRGRTPRAPFQSGALRSRTRTTSRRSSMSTSTPGGTTRPLRRGGGAPQSRSSGFFKKGLKKKKFMKKKIVKTAIGGVNRTIEAGKVQTGTDCVWIGHHTAPRRAMLRQMFMSLLYKLFIQSKMITPGMSETSVIRGLQTSGTPLPQWNLGVNFKSQSTDVAGVVFNDDVENKTLAQLTEWFLDSGRPWNNAIGSQDVEFLEIYLQCLPNGAGSQPINQYTMNVRDVKIHMFIKSSMKIQNRSKAAGTGEGPDDSDQVDNVPIYGKSYSGSGTGLLSKSAFFDGSGASSDLIGDQNYGVILGSESENPRKEPPQPSEFQNVKYSGKVHLDPGFIKTSVLTTKYTMYFNTMFRNCQLILNSTPAATLDSQRWRRLGKFRVFAVEKMIDTGAAELISVAFETNTEISSKCTIHTKRPGVVKSFIKQVLA